MMRIRTIKPEWLEDERMAEASSDARVLSIALILLADDAGRGRLNRATAARCFPADPAIFDRAFAELSGWFVQRYDVRGQGYYAIVNWSKHQRIDKPSKPRTPEPEEITLKANDCDDIGKKPAPQEITPKGDTRESSRDPRETLASPPGPFPDGPGPGPGKGATRARPRVAPSGPIDSGARLRARLEHVIREATGTGPILDHRRGQADALAAKVDARTLGAEVEAYGAWLALCPPEKRPRDPWLRFCDHLGSWATMAPQKAAQEVVIRVNPLATMGADDE